MPLGGYRGADQIVMHLQKMYRVAQKLAHFVCTP